jgi:hypothetical protein
MALTKVDSILVDGAINTTAAGNVGIGTASPISNGGYGGLSLNGTNGALFSMMTNGTESSRFASLNNETSIQSKASTGFISFVQGVSGGTERARIASTGQLLIGTNSITTEEQNGTLLYVNSGMVGGGQKFAQNSASFFNTSTGNTRNITVTLSTTGEYYAKIILVGLCGYFGGGFFTRIVEWAGFAGSSGAVAQISNTVAGGDTPPTATVTSPSAGVCNIAVAFPGNYRCVAYLQTAQATGAYISNISGTNV